MPGSKRPKFDPAQAITDELIRVIERGTLPWRKPWRVAGSALPLRHTGEPYQGINNFLLTMRTSLMGYASPYWMTLRQANELEAHIRKGETSSVVIYYGTSYKDADKAPGAKAGADDTVEGPADDDRQAIPFMKSYRVFNADQIEGLPETFHPKPEMQDGPQKPNNSTPEPIPHMQAFFDQLGADIVVSGREAKYVTALDRIYMPPLDVFETAHKFYGVLSHEAAHWTKPRHRLNRNYGDARFGNTAYAREEIVAELTSLFLGQHLGFAPHTLDNSAAYLDGWIRVLKSDKRAIFTHAGDAQRACQYLIETSETGARHAAA